MHDGVVVATITITYTLLHVGRINNLTEVPPIPALVDLLKFLRPSLAQPGHVFILKPEPLPYYIPLLELQPRSSNFPPSEPMVPEILVPVMVISSSDSHIPAVEPRQASSSSESGPLEDMSTESSQISQRNPVCARSSAPRWIHTPIIPQGRGRRGHRH